MHNLIKHSPERIKVQTQLMQMGIQEAFLNGLSTYEMQDMVSKLNTRGTK